MDSGSRQEYIRAAILFLQNPKLASSTLGDKLDFLKNKGLNQAEIDEALNLALVNRNQAQNGKWNYLLILGFCAAGYKIYQMYQEYQEQLAKRAEEERIRLRKKEDDKRYKQMTEDEERDKIKSHTVKSLKEIMDKIRSLETQMLVQQKSLTSDVQSLKTLMLGHERFAAPPVIPPWQIEQNENNKKKDEEKQESPKKECKSDSKSSSPKSNGHSSSDVDESWTTGESQESNGETPIAP